MSRSEQVARDAAMALKATASDVAFVVVVASGGALTVVAHVDNIDEVRRMLAVATKSIGGAQDITPGKGLPS